MTSQVEEPCGTRRAYQRHVQANEPTDDACRAANAIYIKARRDAWPDHVNRSHRSAKARQAALRRLAVLHASEFESLLRDARREEGL